MKPSKPQHDDSGTLVNKSLLSIDYESKLVWPAWRPSTLTIPAENIEMTDYVKEGDVGFKKPKVNLSVLRDGPHVHSVLYRPKRNAPTVGSQSSPT